MKAALAASSAAMAALKRRIARGFDSVDVNVLPATAHAAIDPRQTTK